MNGRNITNQYVMPVMFIQEHNKLQAKRKRVSKQPQGGKYAVLRNNLMAQYRDSMPVIIQIYAEELPHCFEAIDRTCRDLLQGLAQAWIPCRFL